MVVSSPVCSEELMVLLVCLWIRSTAEYQCRSTTVMQLESLSVSSGVSATVARRHRGTGRRETRRPRVSFGRVRSRSAPTRPVAYSHPQFPPVFCSKLSHMPAFQNPQRDSLKRKSDANDLDGNAKRQAVDGGAQASASRGVYQAGHEQYWMVQWQVHLRIVLI